MKETETDGKLEEISEATSERIPKSSIDRVFKNTQNILCILVIFENFNE